MPEVVRSGRRTFSSEAELADACRRLRLTLSTRTGATPDELAEAWPPDEADASFGDWAFTYGQLMRLFGRERAGAVSSREAEAERAALAALNDEPEAVEMRDGSVVFVYPKGFRTLLWIEDRDARLADVVELRERLWRALQAGSEVAGDHSALELLEVARAGEVRVLAEIAAQLTSEGPRFVAELDGEHLERFLDADPADLLAIHSAHLRVDYVRAQMARVLAPPRKPAGERRTASWSGWLAGIMYRERTTPEAVRDEQSFASLCVKYQLAVPGDDDLEEEFG